jgi:hypothetical protein
MKEQYDFSKGERGKFYRKNTKLNLPIYLANNFLISRGILLPGN